MASGKTTVGRRLADLLSLPHVDTDQEIERREGRTVSRVFAESGETYFREREKEIAEKIISQREDAVVSTGGGFSCSEEILTTLLSSGIVVYLQCDSSTLFERIKNQPDMRPLASANEQQLAAHLSSREHFYKRAHLVVDGSQPIEIVIQKICDFIS